MEPLTLRFRFKLPDDVEATVIQDVNAPSSVVNYTLDYTIFNYCVRKQPSDVSTTLSQRVHVKYYNGKMTNKLTVTYDITNGRREGSLRFFDDQIVPVKTTASFDFTYIKEEGDGLFKLASIHRGTALIFEAGNRSGYFPSFKDIAFELRTAFEIANGVVYVPLIPSKFVNYNDLKIPLEVTQ